jgi:hypothetical protein
MTPQLSSTELGLQERTNYSSCVLDGTLSAYERFPTTSRPALRATDLRRR